VNSRRSNCGSQAGVALTVALLLMLILTLLAVASLHGAGNELALAGNEQFRQQAAAAAEIGIEAVLAALGQAALTPGPVHTEIAVDAAATAGADRATVTTRYLGDASLPAGFSVDRFVARSFEIRSVGSSARGAKAERIQGAIRIDNSAAAFAPLVMALR
jgi:Tfp pilus assembly protein PilX